MSESEAKGKVPENESIEGITKDKSREKVNELDTFMKNFSLYYDKDTCKACGMCEIACPKDAIELGPSGAIGKGVSEMPSVKVDKEKCVLCGICDAICPFGAMELEIDGEHELPVVDLEAFPELIKKVTRDPEKCQMEKECEKVCPVDAISIEDGEWNIDLEICVTCPWCEDACPNDAITVEKMIEGEIEIDTSKCPLGCAVCLDICPVGAIYEPEAEEPWEDVDRIAVEENYCIYCGACVEACPVERAITLKRENIKAEDFESLIWDRSKEKLAERMESSKIEESLEE